MTKKCRFRNTVQTPCRLNPACSPCSNGRLRYCPQHHPPHTPGVPGWWYLCGYTAGLHCDVYSRITHADHKDVLPLKHIRTLVLPAVKVLAFKPLDALGGKRNKALNCLSICRFCWEHWHRSNPQGKSKQVQSLAMGDWGRSSPPSHTQNRCLLSKMGSHASLHGSKQGHMCWVGLGRQLRIIQELCWCCLVIQPLQDGDTEVQKSLQTLCPISSFKST